MGINELILTRYPYILAKRHEAVQLQEEPQLKIFKLIDLFEETLSTISLVGLALYNFDELNDSDVEIRRNVLARPSLGQWLELMCVLQEALYVAHKNYPLPPLNQIYKSGPFFDAMFALSSILGIESRESLEMIDFLRLLVQFRNKKIGHGSLSSWEAKQVLEPLENGIYAWLERLPILMDRPLFYIDRVEWTGYHYLFYGHKLSNGTSIFAANIESESPIFPGRVYLGQDKDLSEDTLIPLYPFFDYDKDLNLLYIFSGLTDNGSPKLHCFYAQSVEKLNRKLDTEPEKIIGKNYSPVNI